MQLSFVVVAISLVILAFCFVLLPLRAQNVRTDRGYAHWSLLAVTLSILLAIGLYLVIGNPRATMPDDDHPAWQQNLLSGNNSTPAEKSTASISSLVDGLAERLRREPDDAGGWLLLAKSYHHLGRMEDARTAYQRASDLGETDPAFADSLSVPDNSATSAGEVRGRVSLAANVAGRVGDSDTVFVVAKAATGSPMPLAVIKKPASELPFEFVLNDSATMVKGMSISAAGEIVVSAKVSPTGDAFQSTQGLQATSNVFNVNNSGYLELEIAATAPAESQ